MLGLFSGELSVFCESAGCLDASVESEFAGDSLELELSLEFVAPLFPGSLDWGWLSVARSAASRLDGDPCFESRGSDD